MAGPVPGVTITGFQRNGFQNNGFQIAGIGNGGKYFLLRPHFVNDVYIDQWTTVTDGVEVPANWVPTMEVDPLNQAAVDAFYAAGPRPQPQSSLLDMQNWNQRAPGNPNVWHKPVTFWFQRGNFWFLSGLGSSKPPVVM